MDEQPQYDPERHSEHCRIRQAGGRCNCAISAWGWIILERPSPEE